MSDRQTTSAKPCRSYPAAAIGMPGSHTIPPAFFCRLNLSGVGTQPGRPLCVWT